MSDGVQQIGKLILVAGVVFLIVGALFMLAGKIPWIGKLPGDFTIQRRNFTFYFPLATSILISIILTFLFWIFGRR
jgi:hypothetical protein